MGIRGLKAHLARLNKMQSSSLEDRIGRALFAGGEIIQTAAQISITTGAVSGKGHVPSKPGEPPSNDSGVLAGNIETTQAGPLKVLVGSYAPYSKSLEFGTSRMAARPFMVPARDKSKKAVRALMAKAINAHIRSARSNEKG